MHHIIVQFTSIWPSIDVINFQLSIVQGRIDVFHAHINETVKITQEFTTNESQQRSYVQFQFLFRQLDTELI